ncbi:MAG: hypothetical protein AB7D36_05475 [Oscillospiraceae bacterium]
MNEEKTNFQQIVELLKEFHPAHRGIIGMSEIRHVSKALNIEQRSILDLRNLRDFVVLYVRNCHNGEKASYYKLSEYDDKMSAITAVIEDRIMLMGGEV